MQIDLDQEEFRSRKGHPPLRLTAAARVHRVSHRIGAVFCGLMVIISACLLAGSILSWSSPVPQLVAGRDADEINRLAPIYKEDGESIQAFIVRRNSEAVEYRAYSVQQNLGFSLFFFLFGLGIYVGVRSIGWIVAGAFPD